WRDLRSAAEAREPIVTALERQPRSPPADSIPDPVPLGGGVVRIDEDRHGRERRRAQVVKKRADVCRDAIHMVVSVHFPELRRLNVSPPEFGFRQSELVDPATATARFEQEISFRISPRVP